MSTPKEKTVPQRAISRSTPTHLWLIPLLTLALHCGQAWFYGVRSALAQPARRSAERQRETGESAPIVGRCEIGAGGYCVEEKWSLARIWLENKSAPNRAKGQIGGRVELTIEGSCQRVLYTTEVNLPPLSKRAASLYFQLPRGFASNLRVSALARSGDEKRCDESPEGLRWLAQLRFVSNDGKTITTFEKWVTIISGAGMIAEVGRPLGLGSLLSLATQEAATDGESPKKGKANRDAQAKEALRRSAGRRPSWRAVNITTDLLPDDWLGYDAFKAVILSKPALGELSLSSRQQEALANWVRRGGRLIVATGADWQWLEAILDARQTPASPLSDLVPASLSTKRVHDLGALSEWCDGEPLPETSAVVCAPRIGAQSDAFRVVLAQNETPLIVKKDADFGEAVFLSFDPSGSPFADWEDKAKFWRKLLEIDESQGAHRRDFSDVHRMLEGQISDFKQARPLGLGYIFLFMLAYVAVIGPLNYLVPRRFNIAGARPLMLLGSVLAFSAIAYAIVHFQKSGGLTLRSLAVVDVSPRSGFMRGVTYTGIFSPQTASYTIVPGAEISSIRPFERGGAYTSPQLYRVPLEIRYARRRFEACAPSRIWSFRAFVSDWIAASYPRLPAGLREKERPRRVKSLAPVLKTLAAPNGGEKGELEDSMLVTRDPEEVVFLGDLDANTKLSDLRALALKHLRKECSEHVSPLGDLIRSLDDFGALDDAVNHIERKMKELTLPADEVEARSLKAKAVLLALTFIADPQSDEKRRAIGFATSVETPTISLRRKVEEGSIFLVGWIETSASNPQTPSSLRIAGARPTGRQVCMVRMELDK